MRLIALKDSCYECEGSSDLLVIPDSMDLVDEMAEYQKWYHDEYQNPDGTDKSYRSFGSHLEAHGARAAGPAEIEEVDESELRYAAPVRWTYTRPQTEMEEYLEAKWLETFNNYVVRANIGKTPADHPGKIIRWHRIGSEPEGD